MIRNTMKKKNRRNKMTALLMAGSMLLALTGCGRNGADHITPDPGVAAFTPEWENLQESEDFTYEEFMQMNTDFSIRLFRENYRNADENQNVLLSPASVLFALGMTANGAKGDTLSEMQQAFMYSETLGKGMDRELFNRYIKEMGARFTNSEDVDFLIANSLWVKDQENLKLNEDFSNVNEEYYNAEVKKAPFDDSTVQDINQWVNENTKGMIPSLLDEIPKDVVMYLINAMAFEGTWEDAYEDYQIDEAGKFRNENGEEVTVTMLKSMENVFLSDENASGFVKYYEGEDYAFLALLPDEGISLSDYIDSLTGEKLKEIYEGREYTSVDVRLPEFTCDYSTELKDSMQALGMELAFSPEADLSGMAESDEILSISRILHKTHITVDRTGTKAAAVTSVEVKDEAAAVVTEEPKQVYLERPFLYMIIDTETAEPIFIGAMNQMQK